MKNILIASAIAMTLVGCGGGGSTPVDNSTSTTPPTTVTPDPKPTKAEAIQAIADHFSEVQEQNFTRYDFITETSLLVSYSPDTTAPTTVIVDFSDTANITYTEVEPTTFYRGVVAQDFDNNGELDLYLYSHGYEIFDENGDAIDSAESGINYLSLNGTITQEGEGYTHGACSGDFNGDTYPDIYDVNAYGSMSLVRYNDGNGSFQVRDIPLELRGFAANAVDAPNFTSCASSDIDGDGYSDVVLGRNYTYNGEYEQLNEHVVLFGSVDGLVYDSNRSLSEFMMYDSIAGTEATVSIHIEGEYIVAFVTDYYNSAAELYKWTDTGYQFVNAIEQEGQFLDVDNINGEFVPRWSALNFLAGYYDETDHYSIVDGKLTLSKKVRAN